MPHMDKNWRPPYLDNWNGDLERKYIKFDFNDEKFKLDMLNKMHGLVQNYNSFENKQTLFSIIEETIDNTITTKIKNNEFFNEFIEVKEASCGRDN